MASANAATPRAPTILVDLGGIFMHPKGERKLTTEDSTISLRRLMSTSAWMKYETGHFSEEECFKTLAQQYKFKQNELTEMIQELREIIPYDKDVASIFRDIKKSGTRIFMVSNISKEDYEALRERWDEEFWSIFDGVFTSAGLGVRKPNSRFYRQVLRATRAVPQRTLFVDDRPENVLAAVSFGMKGTFDTSDLRRTLTNFVGNPVERGLAFLRQQKGQFPTTTQHGEKIGENYALLLIVEALKDPSLVDIKARPRLWNFFSGDPQYTSDTYPDDLDTTSLGVLTFPPAPEVVHSILDQMHDYFDEDGHAEIYFDKSRPRTDVVISLNVLTLFYKYDRGHELPDTLEWIYNVLINRAYINGTRYYTVAEWFLYYMTRLLGASDDSALHERFEAPLRARVIERIGATGDAFCLAMRVIACKNLGIDNYPDRQRLSEMQQEDGGWDASCMYVFPGAKRDAGNRGTTTAFAVKALEGWSA